MHKDLEDQWQQTWVPSEKDRLLHDFARRYCEETEAFDRTICSGPIIQGAIRPMTNAEFVAVNRNAIKVRSRLRQEAAAYGITSDELRSAISHYEQQHG